MTTDRPASTSGAGIPRQPPARTTVAALPCPDPTRLAGLVARAWLEVVAGRRPLAQLDGLLAPAARTRLCRLRDRVGVAPDPTCARVRRVTASRPAADACEAVVLIERAGRTTAIAVRLERHRTTWRVVELTPPEAGLRPLPTASCPHPGRPRDAFDEAEEEARLEAG